MTTPLERTLSEVRAQIHRARISLESDERLFLDHNDCVRTQILTPILTALGWNVYDPNEITIDFALEGWDTDTFLALFLSGTPRLLMDLRGLGAEFDEASVLDELLPLARDAGFEWVILTDGDNYDVFNTHEGLPREQRAFDSIRLSIDPPDGVLEFFQFLSRDQIKDNSIDSEWRCRVVDQQVADALKRSLDAGSGLAQFLMEAIPGVAVEDIQGSLSRAHVEVEFAYRDREEPENAPVLERATGMSEVELRVATWLQRQSIARWARGGDVECRNQASQRRVLTERRLNGDRRSGLQERRLVRVATARERRIGGDRRTGNRRSNIDRRQVVDRRCVCGRV